MVRASVEALLGRVAVDEPGGTAGALAQLIAWVRPARADDTETAIARLEELTHALALRTELRDAIRARVAAWLSASRHVPLYAELGILSTRGFFSELVARGYERLLPAVPDGEDLKDALALIFCAPGDQRWIAGVPDGTWLGFLEALDLFGAPEQETRASTRGGVLAAVEVLSLRIAAEGLEPELLRIDPQLDRYESPFIAQQREIADYLEHFNAWVHDRTLEHYDDLHARVLLAQCTEVLSRVRAIAQRRGTSIGLTYTLARLGQMVARIEALLDMLDAEDARARRAAGLALFRSLLAANAERNRLSVLWRDNIGLLARRVTENASRTGEHYVTSDRGEWLGMLRSAAGAGIVIAFMALIKLQLKSVHPAPLVEAFLVSMNYALGFVLIHMLHFTVATKQPAMTAATIAATVEETGKGRAALEPLAELIVRVLRTQFIAVIGNVMVALPLAALLGWVFLQMHDAPLLGAQKTAGTLRELHPLAGFALLHAAIAGVWLFVSGLISGYYDNRCAYMDIPGRLRAHPFLRRVLPAALHERLANYVDGNLGALAGNFAFGILLGMTGFLGFLLGLPIDIRHVAFASANLGFVLSSAVLPWDTLLAALVFVALIAAVNLAVSFALALYVALRARGAALTRVAPLLSSLWAIVRKRPQELFLPPRPVAAGVAP
ncbi:MAG: site-specific recombinase [Betaproteobacteria bacterium]|nr:site-specific recombinase [Betaproteobacteria bacterium]